MSKDTSFRIDSTSKFAWLSVLFVVILITSNLMAGKLAVFGFVLLPAAVFLYPFCFIVGAVLTEVWGVGKARQVILMGFVANLVLVIFTNAAIYLPFEQTVWKDQASYTMIYQAVPRILFASFVGYLVGEFVNAYVMTWMKRLVSTNRLYVRVIASILVGQVCDTGLFIMIAFYGIMPTGALLKMMLVHYLVKVLIGSVIGTPLVYIMVHWARN
ncbi:MAG: queuosine precursor transporter [Peptococcaceae bacterium]|nr:queuosine precursor transporter [Peptococcaceae bacterium]